MICPKCGAEVADDIYICGNCGEEMVCGHPHTNSYTATLASGGTINIHNRQLHSQKAILCLSYVGFLVVIPLFFCKNTPLARFHINQGLVLFISEIIYAAVYLTLRSILLAISMWLYVIVAVMAVTSIVFAVYAILGIVSVLKSEKRELPVIGSCKLLK